MVEGHGTWVTKGKRVDVSLTWEISIRDKKQEKGNELPYDVLESVSEENDEDSECEGRINS